MSNRKKIFKEKLKDLPYSFGAISLAILFGIGKGIIKTGEGMLMSNKMGVGGAFDWGTKNSGDFISDYIEIKKILKDLKENNSRVVFHRLIKKGLVEKKNNKFQLTALGMKYFKKISNDKKYQNKKSDCKWRIISIDIPEKIRKERNWLRNQLFSLEYQTLQKSVFLGKWPMTEGLFNEITRKKLNKFIRMITVGEIDDEKIFNNFV